MKIQINVDCKCGFKTARIIKRPVAYFPVRDTYNCSGCESKTMAVFKSSKTKGAVDIVTHIVEPSEVYTDLLKEETTL
jgi:3-deoxy-D-arabino-heptulosonate 7-phosphate (DAHP) synthase